jgi:YbbR domain-containing protein
MNFKKLIFNNLSLKLVALLIALFVWVLISGKQRAYQERSLDVNVEYFNVSQNLDVRNVRPEKVRVVVKGAAKEITRLEPDSIKLSVDLEGISESTRLSMFTEDYLVLPEKIEIVSVHPRMIEISTEEFMSREVPVRVLYKGKFKRGVRLIDRKVTPEKVKIFGYKSKILTIDTVYAQDSINLADISETSSYKLPLKKSEEIIRFEGHESVDVTVVVENRNESENNK